MNALQPLADNFAGPMAGDPNLDSITPDPKKISRVGSRTAGFDEDRNPDVFRIDTA
jgi:hypothetical protein